MKVVSTKVTSISTKVEETHPLHAREVVRGFAKRAKELDRVVYFTLFWTVLAHVMTRCSQVLRELAIAAKLGVSAEADLFVFLLFIPNFIHQYLIASFPQAGVPVYLQEELTHGASGARSFHGGVLKFYGATLTVIGGLGVVLGTYFPTLLIPQFTLLSSQQSPTTVLTLLAAIVLLRGLSAPSGVALLARRRFAFPALISCITPLLIASVVFVSSSEVSVQRLLEFLVVGHVMELILVIVALADEQIRPDHRSNALSPPVKQAVRLHLPLILGSSMMGLTALIERWRVGGLSAGELSAFQYAALVVSLPTVIISLPLSQICLTYFSRLCAEELHLRLKRAVMVLIGIAAAAGVVITGIFVIWAHFLAQRVYAFGVFRSSDHALISHLITPLSLQIPAYLTGIVLTQALSALRSNHWITIGSAFNLSVHFVSSGLLVQHFGASGVAFATSLTYTFSVLLLSVFLGKALKKKRLHG